MNEENIIICRCSDINLKELKKLMNDGYLTFEELKRVARIGMGPCQGKTCSQLVVKELSKFLSKPIEEITTHTIRPTVLGVKLKTLAGGAKSD